MPCEGNVLLPVTGDSHHAGWNAAWHGADSLSARCSISSVSGESPRALPPGETGGETWRKSGEIEEFHHFSSE